VAGYKRIAKKQRSIDIRQELHIFNFEKIKRPTELFRTCFRNSGGGGLA
jgi:hypothetical protein